MISTDKESLAIGKTPVTGRKLDVGGDIYANNEQVVTSVVTSYTQGTVRKYSDGTMIFTSVKQATLTSNVAQGNVWGSDQQSITYPVAFIDEPVVTASVYWVSGRPWVGLQDNTSGVSCQYRIMGHSNSTAGRVAVTAIGRWK